MKITALMITPARVAFGMYAKVEVRRPSAIKTIAPETQSLQSSDHQEEF
ncbi:hypothetical protein L798_06738 [Zootermopsis nevadensis]|uniref:Uncharacterized protein n=1 Tax=Zootermopsis nevadensis TaxID=136037 RepID=A0A067RK88_ZOONE|nr:hypothetical protein L798_06738 [Zootermopsis nevadensis]